MITKTKITRDIIKSLNSTQLDELVYNKATNLYLGTFGENFKDTENDKLLKAVFATSLLDAEVKNGGFDQFFLNSVDLVSYALSGLKQIHADKHADILTEAFNIFNQQKEKYIKTRNPNLTSCDDKYYELPNIDPLRQKFVADNIVRFLD